MVTKSDLNQRIKTLEKFVSPSSNHAVIIYKDEEDLILQKAKMSDKKYLIFIPDNSRDTL